MIFKIGQYERVLNGDLAGISNKYYFSNMFPPARKMAKQKLTRRSSWN
jgi:hypothetical protein